LREKKCHREAERIEALLKELAAEAGKLTDIHDVRARHNEHGVFVTFHCRVAGLETVEAVHDAVDTLESAWRCALKAERMAGVRRVIGHAEPHKGISTESAQEAVDIVALDARPGSLVGPAPQVFQDLAGAFDGRFAGHHVAVRAIVLAAPRQSAGRADRDRRRKARRMRPC
jgi:hypothetical protein